MAKFKIGDRVYVVGLITGGYGTVIDKPSHGFPVAQYYRVLMDGSNYSRETTEKGLMFESEYRKVKEKARCI